MEDEVIRDGKESWKHKLEKKNFKSETKTSFIENYFKI